MMLRDRLNDLKQIKYVEKYMKKFRKILLTIHEMREVWKLNRIQISFNSQVHPEILK